MKSNFFSSRWGRFASLLRHSSCWGKAQRLHSLLPVGGEANLQLPDLTQVQFFGMNGHSLLLCGPLILRFGNDLRPGHVRPSEENAGA